MTKQELKAKIDKLENGIKSKATPSNLIAPLKAQKAKLEKELQDMEAAEKKAVKTKKVSKVAEKIKAAKTSVAKKTPAKAPAKEERKKDNIVRDGDRKSLPAGKRISKNGKVYYEMRANRTDKQTSVKPYLAKGGMVKYFDNKEEWRLSRPSGSIEKEVLEKVKYYSSSDKDFVGNFGWRTASGKLAEGYLYRLDESDKDLVKDIKLKDGEKIYRYFTRTTAVGGITPLIKVNLDKGLLYFSDTDDTDKVTFETKGTSSEWVSLIKDKMADGGELTEKKLLVLKADDKKGGNVFVSEEVVKVKDLDDAKSKVKEFVSKYNLDDKTFTGGRYFKLVKTSKKMGNVTSSDVKSEELGTIDYKGNFKSSGSKMADGGETDWGADLGGGFSIGNDVYITDSKSLFQGKTGFVSGSVGRDLLVTILDNGNERSVVVSKKGVEKLDAPEYAKGGSLNNPKFFDYYQTLERWAHYRLSVEKGKDYYLPTDSTIEKILANDIMYNDGKVDKSTHDKMNTFLVQQLKDLKMNAYPEYADGGYVIFEGRDNYNDKPLYKVISKDEDNDYDGEFHDNREDAEKELKELKNKDMKYAKGGEMYARQSIKSFYVNTYPTDELGQEINDEASFEGLNKVLDCNIDVYEYLGVGDSLVRERVFAKLAELMGVSYNVIYDKWLGTDYAKGGYMASGGEVPAHFGSGRNIDVFGYQTQHFDICGAAVKEFESAMEIMQNGKESEKESLARCAKYVDGLFGIEKLVVETAGTDDANFYDAVSDIMSASIYNYRAEMSINLFSFVPQHLKEIAVRMAKAEKGGFYALGGMTAGRWYRDKSGEEFKFIGKIDSGANKGKFLFTDGQKSVYKDLEDFEGGRPKETKLFGFFEHGGEVGKSFSIKDMREKLDRMFPDSFKFNVTNFSKEGNAALNSSALLQDMNTKYGGLEDKEINSKLFFPQYKRDHDIKFRIAQGGENTYFYFVLEAENGEQYIGNFGFKDRGDVSSDYITRFIALLMEQYGLPFEVKHSVMEKGGYMEYGGSVAEGNYEMLMSNIKAIKHHAEELEGAVNPSTEIEAWVLSKSERAETDLSDITHYLDGLKMEKGGTLEMEEFYLYDENGKKYEFYKKEGDNYMFSSYKVPFGKALTIEKSELQEKIKDGKYKVVASHAKGGYMAEGGGVGEIDMEKVESAAKFYTDESRWSTKPTISKFEEEIKEIKELKRKLDNKETTPSKIIGSGYKPQFARPLAYKWLKEKSLIAERAIEMLKEKEKMASGGEFKPYGKTKGKYKIEYTEDGEKQSEVWESKEMVEDRGKRLLKLGHTNIKITELKQMAKGGIYSSDSLYILKVSKDGKEVGEERFRAKNIREAKEMGEDYEEKYKTKFGGDLSFSVKEAMAKGGETNYTKKWKVVGITMQGKRFEKQITLGRMSDKNDVKYALKRMPDTQIREITMIEEMASGGKVKFADKVKSVQESLLKRKKVSPKVQKDYGKTYSKEEAKESAQRIVGSRMAQLKEKMAKKKK